MARRPTNIRPTSTKKIKVNENKPKRLPLNKMTPEMSTLKTFGIVIGDPEKAKKAFNEIALKSKLTGMPIPLVAKEYLKKNLKK